MAFEALEAVGDKGWLYHPSFPEHWTRRKLYSMARWVNGLAFRDIQFSASGKPVIKIAEIKGGISGQTKFTEQTFDESVRVKPGDLLFSWSGQPETSIDAFWWRGPEGWLNQHVFRVTPAEGIDTVFFFYLLRYLKPNFVGIARNKQTTGLGHVTKRDLENIEAAHPSVPEQRAIAHILGTLDGKIELNRRMSGTLEAMARALFKCWFVDFDPIRAKMEGRDPGLPPHLAALFPDRLVESDLGEIPEGWSVKGLLDVARLISGGTPKTDVLEYWDGDIAWASAKDVSRCGQPFLIESERSISQLGLNNSATRLVPARSTVVVARGATTGRFTMLGHEMAMNQTCYALKSTSGHDFWLNSVFANAVAGLVSAAHGSVFDTITTRTLEAASIVDPGAELKNAYEAFASPNYERLQINLQQSRILAAFSDLLLPRLISGALRVKDAENFLGRVL